MLHQNLKETSLQVRIFGTCEFLNAFVSAFEIQSRSDVDEFRATDFSVPFGYQGEDVSPDRSGS